MRNNYSTDLPSYLVCREPTFMYWGGKPEPLKRYVEQLAYWNNGINHILWDHTDFDYSWWGDMGYSMIARQSWSVVTPQHYLFFLFFLFLLLLVRLSFVQKVLLRLPILLTATERNFIGELSICPSPRPMPSSSHPRSSAFLCMKDRKWSRCENKNNNDNIQVRLNKTRSLVSYFVGTQFRADFGLLLSCVLCFFSTFFSFTVTQI